ncbi:MAG: OsmC family protein, partial [Actinomycetota bacterium]|nr:OsmC family protein [Actinomycetota bacterium]
DDGRYAFVSVEVHFEVELDPEVAPDAANELIAYAEKGCFVGNSLVATPRYHWTVNGNPVA